MSICKIYACDQTTESKYESGTLRKHHEMSNWLQNKGRKEYVYEIHKGGSIHSRWIWKEKNECWGRTATPSVKKLTVIEDLDAVPHKKDRISRKKARQENHKFRSNNGRQPRG